MDADPHAAPAARSGPPPPLAAHPGWARVFGAKPAGRPTLGFMMPVARGADRPFPDMGGQFALAARIDALGFAALRARDVPLHDPAFGDAGLIHDPWVWLGQLAAATRRIALATGGVVLPVRHPLHVAKAAASVDAVSGGRFLLGLASGDRPAEFPAFGVDHAARGGRFRAAWEVVDRSLHEAFPAIASPFGAMRGGVDLVPKPATGRLPMVAVGSARQTIQWVAAHADAWVTYPRGAEAQRGRIGLWRTALEQRNGGRRKPFAQSLFVDLADDPEFGPEPIPLGFRLGRARLVEHLETLRALGVDHVFLNLRHSARPAAEVVEEIAAEVLPRFPTPGPVPPAAVGYPGGPGRHGRD